MLIHGVGPDGNRDGVWMASIEAQVIEGGVGDFIAVRGADADGNPVPVSSTAEAADQGGKYPVWTAGGEKRTFPPGHLDWCGKAPDWNDVLGFRGENDVEQPHGRWNRMDVVGDGQPSSRHTFL